MQALFPISAKRRDSGLRGPSGSQHTHVDPVANEKNVDAELERLCRPWPQARRPGSTSTSTTRLTIPARDIAALRTSLAYLDAKANRQGDLAWSLTPLTYAILRNIKALEYMPHFRQDRFTDFHLPYNERTLPILPENGENRNLRQAFLKVQHYFLTDTKRMEEEGTTKHFLLEMSGDHTFQRVKELGQGSYGGVDLVRSVLSFKHYARKRVLRGRDSERSREAQNAMINELRQLKRLSHIHLVKIITSYTDNEYIAYLMEPIADCTLETLLATNSPPTPDYKAMVRTFYGCLAGALNYLHKNKVRHRDITARNILIKRGQVYLADFGSAYNSSHCVGSATRHLHTPVSMDYMAPEVAKREERDSKSDMFSLGVIFLEMTTSLLGRSITELKRVLRNYAAVNKSNHPHVHANLPAAVAWVDELRRGSTVDHDNEPLGWVRFLIQEKPSNRPSAVGLMEDILNSPSFMSFCCLKCRQEFEEHTFAYEAAVREESFSDSQDTRRVVENIFGASGPGDEASQIQPAKFEQVTKWLCGSPKAEGQATSTSTAREVQALDPDQGGLGNATGAVLENSYIAISDYYADCFNIPILGDNVQDPVFNFNVQPLASGLAHSSLVETSAELIAVGNSTDTRNYAIESSSGNSLTDTDKYLRDTGLGFQEWGSSDSEDESDHRLFNEISDESDSSSDAATSAAATERFGTRDWGLEAILERAENSDDSQQGQQVQHLFEEVGDSFSEGTEDEYEATSAGTQPIMDTNEPATVNATATSKDVPIQDAQLLEPRSDHEQIVGEREEPKLRVIKESSDSDPLVGKHASQPSSTDEFNPQGHSDEVTVQTTVEISNTEGPIASQAIEESEPLEDVPQRIGIILDKNPKREAQARKEAPTAPAVRTVHFRAPSVETVAESDGLIEEKVIHHGTTATSSEALTTALVLTSQEKAERTTPPKAYKSTTKKKITAVGDGATTNDEEPPKSDHEHASASKAPERPLSPRNNRLAKSGKHTNASIYLVKSTPSNNAAPERGKHLSDDQIAYLNSILHADPTGVGLRVGTSATRAEPQKDTSQGPEQDRGTNSTTDSRTFEAAPLSKANLASLNKKIGQTHTKNPLDGSSETPKAAEHQWHPRQAPQSTRPDIHVSAPDIYENANRERRWILKNARRGENAPERPQKPPRVPRKRDMLPPIDVKALMKTTWETASAPTSVMSETTKKKLSDIIVPYNSFDVTNNMLRDFCKEGKASAVRFLLLKGCNPGTKKRPRSAPLLVAIQGASERHNKCVRELIKYDVDVNVRKKGSRNPALHLAIENAGSDSYVKLIWLLVNAGANLDSLDSNGDTALTKLFSGEDSWPLERHRLEALALLLQGGVQVNYQAPGTGNTPLHLAVRRKDKWAVAMLLYQGADVNAKNYAGSTPLQVTANQFRGDLSPDHAQVLDLLLQADASIDEPAGALRRTALHNAVASNTAYAVRLLLQYGADPKLVDNEGRDAMQLAIQGASRLTSNTDRIDDHVEIMDQLGRALGGSWANIREHCRTGGVCAIGAACAKGNLDMLRALIDHGKLDKRSKFRDGTVLSFAESSGASEAVSILNRTA